MDDLISRQAAIDAIKEMCLHYTPTKSVTHPHMDFVINELEELPPAQPEINDELFSEYCKQRNLLLIAREDFCKMIAQPEQKTGQWQITDAYPHNIYCSVCHKKFAQTHWTVWEDGSLPRAYCPNCGAKMEVIKDD